MTLDELKELIRKELHETIKLHEKSVPQPYNRKEARPMSNSQIQRRDKIGNAMKNNSKIVKKFKDMHGNEWEDYLWATATSKALKGGE